MLEIRGIWLCHMSRWDRYVLRPRIWVETPRSGTVPHVGPYSLDPCGYGIVVFLFASRHLNVVCTQTYIFRCCIVFEAVVCRLYEMLYPCIYNVVISYWKSGAYGYVICRGGTDMCFVPGSGTVPHIRPYRYFLDFPTRK